MVTFVVLRIAAVVLLVAANAFFVAAEFALVSIRETRLQQLIAAHRIGARTVQKLHQKLDEFIAAVQFGVTLCQPGPGLDRRSRHGPPALNRSSLGCPHAHLYAHAVSIVAAFLLITYMHVILGELVPKVDRIAAHRAVALAVAGPMDVFMTLAAPLLAVMSASSRVVLKAFGARQMREGSVHSAEELKLIVSASRRIGVLEAPAGADDPARARHGERLRARGHGSRGPTFSRCPATCRSTRPSKSVADEQHSRVPVYDPQRGPEHIIGVLYAKDLLRWLRYRLSPSTDQSIVRTGPATSKCATSCAKSWWFRRPSRLTDLLTEFKAAKTPSRGGGR